MLSVNLLATAVVGFYASSINAADYGTYPTVAHTASINGFADKIYDRLPECAKPCVEEDTGITPCPYWDPGCLCVMSNWGGEVAECIAENCQGSEVSTATSLATSICSSAGVPSPFWFIPASASADLLEAAEATITDDAPAVETTVPTSSVPVTSDPAVSEPASSESVSSESASSEPAISETTSSAPATTNPATSDSAENPYATFPTVARTASINGFADKLYDQLPECAKPCVEEDTGITPCPYWDPGCLCVMSNWGGEVAECIAENCQGSEVSTATSLATSVCSSAGVPSPYWYIPASASADLLQAATAAAAVTDAATTPEPATSDPANSDTAKASEAISSSVSSVAATNSDGRHTNATSTDTHKSVTTATICSSCTKNITFNSTKSNGSVVTKTAESVVSSESNEEYTFTSAIGSDATKIGISTTVVTVTSCESNKCSDILKTTGLTVVSEEHTSYTTYCPLPTDSESIVTTSIVSCDKNNCKSIPTTIAKAITSEYDTQSKISKHASSHATETGISSAPTLGANELLYSSGSTAIANETSESDSDNTNNLNPEATSPSSGSPGSGSPGSQSVSPVSVSSQYTSSSISNAFETATLSPSVFEGSAPVTKQWSLSSLIALFAFALF